MTTSALPSGHAACTGTKEFRSHLSQLPRFTEGGTDKQGARASPPGPPGLLGSRLILQLLELRFNLFLDSVTVYLFIFGCVGSSFLCEGFL